MSYFYQSNISTIELTVNGLSKFKGVDTSTPGILQVYDNDRTNYAQIQAPSTISTNYTLILPTDDGNANQVLQTNGSGILSWANNSTLSGSGLIGLIENNSIWLGTNPSSTTDTAEKNVAIGIGSLDAITTGDHNVVVGYNSGTTLDTGYKNVLLGSLAGQAITTGTENVIIGYNSDPSSATGTNQIVIGSGSTGQGDNKVVIGNASITDVYMASDASATVRCGNLETSGDINLASGKEVKINGTNILSTIQSDITTLQNTDTSIQSSLNDKATISSVNDEISAREDADADLQGNIDLKSNIDDPTFTTKITTPSIDTPQLMNASTIALTSTGGGVNITSAAGTAGIIKMNPGTGGLITKRAVQTVADSVNDSTAAQYVAGFINCTGGGADTWTLPTGADLADAMPSDTVTVGDSFICYVVNASGGDITYSAGASGSTISSSGAGTLVQKTASLAQLHFIFTVDTGGSEEYHCLLIADNS